MGRRSKINAVPVPGLLEASFRSSWSLRWFSKHSVDMCCETDDVNTHADVVRKSNPSIRCMHDDYEALVVRQGIGIERLTDPLMLHQETKSKSHSRSWKWLHKQGSVTVGSREIWRRVWTIRCIVYIQPSNSESLMLSTMKIYQEIWKESCVHLNLVRWSL